MKDYLICLDLDGTLLDDKKNISEKNIQTLKKLKQDNKIILASGRPLRAILAYYELLELDTPIISDNGGVITEINNKEFNSTTQAIDIDVFLAFYNDTLSYTVSCFYSVNNYLYIYKPLERLNGMYHIDDETIVYDGVFTKDVLHHSPHGLIYIIETNKMTEFEELIKSKYDKQISCRSLGYDPKHAIYEVYKYNLSKGQAVEQLQERYNIPKERTIAFGDGENDISMLKVAKYSVAMKQGMQTVIDCAAYVSSSTNNENPISDFLEDLDKNL